MIDIDNERKAFEAWFLTTDASKDWTNNFHDPFVIANSTYGRAIIQLAFEAWLAGSKTIQQTEHTLWEEAGFVKLNNGSLVSPDEIKEIYDENGLAIGRGSNSNGDPYCPRFEFDCTIDELLQSIARARGRE